MMRQITIEVRIDKAGRTKMHVAGAQGESCTSLTKALEERLGKVEKRDYTKERDVWLTQEAEQPNVQAVRRQ